MVLSVSILAFLVACGKPPEPGPEGSWVILDQPTPTETNVEEADHAWSSNDDPLWVANIDVVDPTRSKYVEELRAGISEERAAAEKLDGITVTIRRTRLIDEEGRPILDADGDPKEHIEWIKEYWFKGSDEPNHEGDEVKGTGFVIPKGWQPPNTDQERTARGPRSGLPRGYMPPYGQPRK